MTSFAVPVCRGRRLITECARCTNDDRRIDWFWARGATLEELRRLSSAKSDMNMREVHCSVSSIEQSQYLRETGYESEDFIGRDFVPSRSEEKV